MPSGELDTSRMIEVAEALQWVEGLVRWYNDEHLHSGIRYVTPATCHAGNERPVLAHRHDVYTTAPRCTITLTASTAQTRHY
jgi:hypothetical protein